jgi:hypothetical protein
MVTSNLMGGLGNYLFQIASVYSLALDNNDEAVFNINDSVTGHQPIKNYTNNILSKINFVDYSLSLKNDCYEPFFHYQKIPYKANQKLHGYFQSEKYFIHNRQQILDLYDIDEESKKEIDKKYGEILVGNTCSLHVRRGDYLKYPNHHPTCTLEYYSNSIKEFSKDTKFLIFSDDINWCKKVFTSENFIFIEGNKDYIDLWLMSLCKNNIIANSSFSWWGAWLNQNPNKKVITPTNWFGSSIPHNTKDLIPISWIKI